MQDTNKLQQAIKLSKEGDKTTARSILISIIRQAPNNETAWVWFVRSLDTDLQRAAALHQFIKLNPENQSARRALLLIQQRSQSQSAAGVADGKQQVAAAKPPGRAESGAIRNINVTKVPEKRKPFIARASLVLLLVVVIVSVFGAIGVVVFGLFSDRQISEATKIGLNNTPTQISPSPTPISEKITVIWPTTVVPTATRTASKTPTITDTPELHYLRLFYSIPNDGIYVVENDKSILVAKFDPGNSGHISLGGQPNIFGEPANLWLADSNGSNPKKIMDASIFQGALGQKNIVPMDFVVNQSKRLIIVGGVVNGTKPPNLVLAGLVTLSMDTGEILSVFKKKLSACEYSISPSGETLAIIEPGVVSFLGINSEEQKEALRYPVSIDKNGVRECAHPIWSGTGRVLFVAVPNSRKSTTTIFQIRGDGGVREITNFNISILDFNASPDGNVFVGSNSERTEIYSGQNKTSTEVNVGGHIGFWSHDSQKVLIYTDSQIRILNLASLQKVENLPEGAISSVLWIENDTFAFILSNEVNGSIVHSLYTHRLGEKTRLLCAIPDSVIFLYAIDLPPSQVQLLLERQTSSLQATTTLTNGSLKITITPSPTSSK